MLPSGTREGKATTQTTTAGETATTGGPWGSDLDQEAEGERILAYTRAALGRFAEALAYDVPELGANGTAYKRSLEAVIHAEGKARDGALGGLDRAVHDLVGAIAQTVAHATVAALNPSPVDVAAEAAAERQHPA